MEKAAAAVKGDKTLEFNVRTARFGVDAVRLEIFRNKSKGKAASKPPAEIRQAAVRALAFVDEVNDMRICNKLPRHNEILAAWRRLSAVGR